MTKIIFREITPVCYICNNYKVENFVIYNDIDEVTISGYIMASFLPRYFEILPDIKNRNKSRADNRENFFLRSSENGPTVWIYAEDLTIVKVVDYQTDEAVYFKNIVKFTNNGEAFTFETFSHFMYTDFGNRLIAMEAKINNRRIDRSILAEIMRHYDIVEKGE